MSTNTKRARACDACHILKIRCELGTSGGLPPCARCMRLSKDCTITPPKRQKDRVAELEAQVAALTNLLRAQGINDIPGEGTPSTAESISTPSESTGKRRRRSNSDDQDDVQPDSRLASVPPRSSNNADLTKLDRLIPLELQAAIFDRYRNEHARTFPLVPLDDDETFESVRENRPAVYHAMIFAAGCEMLTDEQEKGLASILMGNESDSIVTTHAHTVELAQTIQILTLWYRTPSSHRHIAVWLLIPLLQKVVDELGLWNSGLETSPETKMSTKPVSPPDAWRVCLGTYMFTSSSAILLRQAKFAVPWTQQHANYLLMLEYGNDALQSDKVLGQHVRAQRLCTEIIRALNMAESETFVDIAAAATQETAIRLQGELLNWQFQIPQHLRSDPCLMFWQYAATMYINEPVLHTPTNKHSFGAPYVVEVLSVTDYPRPLITPYHVSAMRAMIGSCHAMIDLLSAFDMSTLLVFPGLLYAPRVAYAACILIKMYIAITAADGTFGAVVMPAELMVEEYLAKILATHARIVAISDKVGPSRVLNGVPRLLEWFLNFKSVLSSGTSVASTPANSSSDSSASPGTHTQYQQQQEQQQQQQQQQQQHHHHHHQRPSNTTETVHDGSTTFLSTDSVAGAWNGIFGGVEDEIYLPPDFDLNSLLHETFEGKIEPSLLDPPHAPTGT